MLQAGSDDAKVEEVERWQELGTFTELERAVLGYAEAVTRSDRDVDEELFAEMRSHFTEAELVELTAWICLENFYSKFNRSFRIEAQGFCVVPGRSAE